MTPTAGPETTTLAGYRQRHAQYKTDLDLQAAHAAAPWLVVWDDHEVDNNWADTLAGTPEENPGFIQRRAAAFQAFYENLPLRTPAVPQGSRIRLYRALAWGDLMQLSLLDTRQYRTDQVPVRKVGPAHPSRLADHRTMMGRAQEQWLMRRFEEVIDAANVRLAQFSESTLELVRDTGKRGARKTGLDLLVIDHRTDEARRPETLSGGETFFVSLALALGLAELVTAEAGGVQMDTLFIDEGFGSLDPEALDRVVAEINRLAEHGPTEDELARAVAQYERDWLWELATTSGRADAINEAWLIHGSPHEVNTHLADVLAVTPDDVAAAARRWLSRSSAQQLHYRAEEER